MASLAGPGTRIAPPYAARRPVVEILHGDERVDDYAWLRDRQDPAVAAHLKAENAYCEAVLEPLAPLREGLYREMLARIQETDSTVPWPMNGWWYYSRTVEGLQYPILCRRRLTPGAAEATPGRRRVTPGAAEAMPGRRRETPGSAEAMPGRRRDLDEGPEQVTLDLNALAAGESFMSVGAYAVSDDGTLLAYSTDVTGFRQYTLFVKDLATGDVLEKVAERVGSVAWAADDRTLFYTVEEESTKRQHRLLRHVLGSGSHDLVYEEPDQAFSVDVDRTRSRAYLILGIDSLTTSEARWLPAAEPRGEWRVVAPRVPEREYEVDHHGDHFYLRVNDTGRTFRVVRAPVDDPSPGRWAEVLPCRPEVMLEGLDVFAGHLVVFEREAGLPHVRVGEISTGEWHRISFPEPVYSVQPGPNAEFDTAVYRYEYESLVTPPSVYDYDLETRVATLRKRKEVKGGYDPSAYATERVFATAPDGMRVPVSIVYRRAAPRDGRGPLYLYGYGSYGFPLPIAFSPNRLSLLDRGVVMAFAHVRGGGDLGKPWHDDGRMARKRNTFTDFVACAEHLLEEGYGARERLVIEGGSAGGLLVGAVANMRPDLFRAAVLQVPFVDVINTMLDETLPLTVGEFEEWGNPKKKAEYEYMRTYCPYTNLRRADYPAMLVRTSFHDSQVMYWEPAKYVAKLRTLATGDRPLLLETNMDAGHGGSSGRYDRLREIAFDYAFVLWQMGLSEAG